MSKDDEDKKAFLGAMKGVKPLKPDNKIKLDRVKKKPKVAQRSDDHDFESTAFLSMEHEAENLRAGETIEYRVSGVSACQLKPLRQGKVRPRATLDLHNMTIPEAAEALEQFIQDARCEKWRVVCVVHGQGFHSSLEHPPLKNKVNTWLRQLPGVLAFCSTPVRLGGAGAVLVLLK